MPDAARARSPRRELIATAVTVALAAAAAVIPVAPAWVERGYAGHVYPFLQPRVTWLANLVPFALDDLVLTVAVAAVVSWTVFAVIRPRTHLWRLLTRTATLAAALFLVSVLTFGVNFRRAALRDSERFAKDSVTHDGVVALAERAVGEMNAAYSRLPAVWPDWAEMHAQMDPALERARNALGMPWRPRAARPKQSVLNVYLERTGLNGLFLPYFHEVTLNQSLLPFERPYVLAHEWGHAAGRANESEAAYFGWLTCTRGPVWASYSAWHRIYGYAMAELPRADRIRISALLEPGPRADRAASSARILATYNVRAARVRRTVEGQMSSLMRVRPEQRDYGLVVQLILGLRVDSTAR